MLKLFKTFAFAAAFIGFADDASACRGIRNWSYVYGDDLHKLKTGEIAVRAKLIVSYVSEQDFNTIMGSPKAMAYRLQILEVLGSAPDVTDGGKDIAGAVLIGMIDSYPCEQYVPRKFSAGDERLLVLRKASKGVGFYYVVGGQ